VGESKPASIPMSRVSSPATDGCTYTTGLISPVLEPRFGVEGVGFGEPWLHVHHRLEFPCGLSSGVRV
jgi:hypothetical protein